MPRPQSLNTMTACSSRRTRSSSGDGAYSSTSEAELDSDHELDLDAEVDPQKLLGAWLGELDAIHQDLNGLTSFPAGMATDPALMSTPRLDGYRFSMVNLEESQDVELDAILGELCALETQFEREIKATAAPPPSCTPTASQRSSTGCCRTKLDYQDGTVSTNGGVVARTDSPDNDSAFSDNVSMLSSESSASSGGGNNAPRTEPKPNSGLASSPCQLLEAINVKLRSIQAGIELDTPPPAEQAARLKAEKIRIALEKMKEASVQKLFIKAFSADNSAKSLLVDERMSIVHVTRLLADKNHVPMDPKWAILESIPQLYMERVYEDHENLVENLLLWTRDSSNRILFVEREEKYDLFVRPENYLLGGSSSEHGAELDDDAKLSLIDEFFGSSRVPEVEGLLYLKSDGKKVWKKHFCLLRASGLYYCPKGKSKLPKDLVCLTTFEMNNIYVGFGWKKKYKAPTDYGFAIKHPQIQTKSSKYIKYLCAEDKLTLQRWVTGCRIAKYGRIIKENYDNLMRDIVEEDLETLAHARSFSINSMARAAVSPDSGSPELACPSSSERRGSADSGLTITASSAQQESCSGVSLELTATPTEQQQIAFFDADAPVGTIKRKPSMTPKIPLTNTTRTLAKQSSVDLPDNAGIYDTRKSLTGSLGRVSGGRMSLRRSQTDERICASATLSRKTSLPSNARPPSCSPERHVAVPPAPEHAPNIGANDLAGSTLSLESFPPPPPPLQLGDVLSWPSTSSLNSLPPPPSELATPTNSPDSVTPTHSPPAPIYADPICSVARSEERPSLQHVVVRQKPPPPKRSESTRLSSSAWRSSPAGPVTCSKPPDVFLQDLQRVMEKKWKVAQQLSSEPTATPHEILGFRDPCCLPPPGTECADDGTFRRKIPPPPPPKRSDATQLTRKVC
ncbi:ras-associated and pleckstrin homology domains-containing protein 1-like isoform X2 [Rhipicephalus microplus]|uniref:ras-associated and pleckstrin homology domains-containing protein 1-like isoform X2 n=1 Tax=Rhipicephalus microplus TaxID=6941 RepID=UPI003F6C85A1